MTLPDVSRLARAHTFLFAAALTVVLLVANVLALPRFGSPSTWASTLGAFAPLAITAMASTPAILSGGGGLDISIGPVVTLVNVVLVVFLLPGGLGQPVVAVPLLVALGAAVGATNGLLVTVGRFQPVVATLCAFFVIGGLDLALAPTPRQAAANWTDQLSHSIGPFPGGLLTIGIPLLVWAGLGLLAYRRTLYSVGGSDAAAYTAGVNVALVRVLAYALGGAFAAIGGIALTGLIRSADASIGTQYALIALAAVALGGTPIGGGRGGLAGSVLGAAVIFLIQNALISLHVPVLWLQVVYGALLVTAVVLNSRVAAVRPR